MQPNNVNVLVQNPPQIGKHYKTLAKNPSNSVIHLITRLIQIFLSLFHNFDAAFSSINDTILCYSFLTLRETLIQVCLKIQIYVYVHCHCNTICKIPWVLLLLCAASLQEVCEVAHHIFLSIITLKVFCRFILPSISSSSSIKFRPLQPIYLFLHTKK